MSLENLLKSVGRRIAELRNHRSLTQKKMSQESGIPYRYLQSIESGRVNVTLKTLHRIGKLLHVPVAEILAPKEKV